MIPLFDLKKSKKFPYITVILITINIVLFFLFKGDFEGIFFEGIFLHINIWHLLFNMWFLWIFGDNVEGRIGHLKFFFFYFLCGIIPLLFLREMTSVPAVGASSAIAGVMGAYLFLFPKNKLKVFPNFVFPSFLYIILWALIQVLFFSLDGGMSSFGHIAGFVTGFILILFFK